MNNGGWNINILRAIFNIAVIFPLRGAYYIAYRYVFVLPFISSLCNEFVKYRNGIDKILDAEYSEHTSLHKPSMIQVSLYTISVNFRQLAITTCVWSCIFLSIGHIGISSITQCCNGHDYLISILIYSLSALSFFLAWLMIVAIFSATSMFGPTNQAYLCHINGHRTYEDIC